MRLTLIAIFSICAAAPTIAHDLGARAPIKSPSVTVVNVPDPERQGGDTIETALVIPQLPFTETGTTTGYDNDYDEVCPYTGSTAADVVYRFTPPSSIAVNIDLCGSAYDTKLYVYDSALHLLACNDDFYVVDEPCGLYVSKLENLALAGGQPYYIIVDGYGSAHGDYVLEVNAYVPCILDCPMNGLPEGEPPLDYEYVDDWNGGCNTFGAPFQYLPGLGGLGQFVLCGVSGWYLVQGGQFRDTDWFLLRFGPGGSIDIVGEAEYATFVYELGPHDCNVVDIVQTMELEPCLEGTMTITGYDVYELVWLWVGPTVFAPPDGWGVQMYDYVLWITGLYPPVATGATSWSTVKALFD